MRSSRVGLVVAVVLFLVMGVGAVKADLTAHWAFDEASGSIAYDSAGTKNGTINGAAWTSGKIGGALHFDGIDDAVILPDNSPKWLPQNDFSVAMWFKLDLASINTGVAEVLFGGDGGFSGYPENRSGITISREASNLMRCYLVIDNQNYMAWGNTNVEKDAWYHIAAVRQGTSLKLYLNGMLDGSTSCGSGIVDYDGDYSLENKVKIGAFHHNSDQIFPTNGSIDDVRIYNSALTQQEIQAIIPEPATLSLLALGGLFLRKRK